MCALYPLLQKSWQQGISLTICCTCIYTIIICMHVCTTPSPLKILTTSKISDNLLHVYNIIIMCTTLSPSKILTTRKISDNLLHVYNIYNYVHYTLSFKNPDNKENSWQFGARIIICTMYNYMHYTISFKNPDNKENSWQFGARIHNYVHRLYHCTTPIIQCLQLRE